MKMRTTLCLLLAFLSFQSQAQNWVDVGLKGNYGISHLFNVGVLNNPNYAAMFTYNGSYGGKVGFNIGEFHEITFDGMWGKFGQNYDYSIEIEPEDHEPFTGSIGFKTTELILMYRNNNEGRYFEVGPSYTLVKGAAANFGHLSVQPDDPDALIQPYTSMVMGFGAYVMGTDYFGITMGFRMSYALTDITTTKGQAADFPSFMTNEEEYTQTHPLFFGVSMEANFDLAYLAKANCGKRKKLLLFAGH